MQEVWKDVVGYEKYFRISKFGSVWSKRSNKLLKTSNSGNGYLGIATKIGGRDGKNICLKIHRMVAEAYLPPPSKELVAKCEKEHWGKVIVRHKDGDKLNNVYTNLEWGTTQDNVDDHWKTENAMEKQSRGAKHGRAKLTDVEVSSIRSSYVPRSRVHGCRALGERYGISHAQISNVVNMKSYK